MPIANSSDEFVPTGNESTERKQWADGTYKTQSIRWFSHSKDTQLPIFIEWNGGMAARCYTLLADSPDEGPPFTVMAKDIPLLVQAFGGNPGQLPDMQADYSLYLIAAQKLATGKVANAVVKNGWVDEIEGMTVPEDFYRVVFRGIKTRNDKGQASWTINSKNPEWGKFYIPRIEILSKVDKSPSPYAGVVTEDTINYGLYCDGDAIRVETNAETGKWNANGTRAMLFMRAIAPEVEHLGGYQDRENLCPEIEEYGLKNSYVFNASRKRGTKGGKIKWDWGNFKPTGETLSDTKSSMTPSPKQADSPSPVLPILFRLLSVEANRGRAEEEGKLVVTDDGLSFSDAGKKWAKEYGMKEKIVSLKPHTNFFSKMTDAELIAICSLIGGESWKATAEGAVGSDDGDL